MGALEGKVAVITGGGSGIGAATAARFVREGAKVVGFDVAEPTDAWPTEDASLFVTGDVRSESDVAGVMNRTVAELGQIDVLVNAAGVAGGGPIHAMDAEEWDRVVDINLKGTFLACKHALAHMVERQTGSVVNIASVDGLEAQELTGSYNASKGGVILLTRNLAIDYARKGIRANAVCPGYIETPLLQPMREEGMQDVRAKVEFAHHMGRFGRPEEIASAILFLSSDEASFVNGHSLVVDGGFTAGKRFGLSELMGLE